MCNAWNHSIDCTCGWGGEGHSGRRSLGNVSLHVMQPKFKTYNEFLVSCTIPNAKCPECGNPVFFYRSPSNGRVFFDELGPPWPKHPCTTSPNKSIPANNFVRPESIDLSTQYYVNSQWKPFLVEGLFKVDLKKRISEIVGYINDQKRSFFTRLEGITTDFPFFIKETDSEIRLLTFKPDSESYLLEFIVKKYQSELMESVLGGSSPAPKVAARVKQQNPSNHRSGKNFKSKREPNSERGKSEDKKVKSVRPKLPGKMQDQLLKLRNVFKTG